MFSIGSRLGKLIPKNYFNAVGLHCNTNCHGVRSFFFFKNFLFFFSIVSSCFHFSKGKHSGMLKLRCQKGCYSNLNGKYLNSKVNLLEGT